MGPLLQPWKIWEKKLSDKLIEERRYDIRAKSQKLSGVDISSGDNYLSSLPKVLRQPYKLLQRLFDENISSNMSVLEIGSGTGGITNWLIDSNAEVFVSDISSETVSLLKAYYSEFPNVKAIKCDMEFLPFRDESFDAVVSAGSLSYGDNTVTAREIYRVLKNGGKFICVDSLNNNPIYRINRYIHFLRGHRTKSTLKRMPNIKLIRLYEKQFGAVDVYFFGSLNWFLPLLGKFINEETLTRFSNWFDSFFNVSSSAFKFVMLARKKMEQCN